MKFNTILIDPPWPMPRIGKSDRWFTSASQKYRLMTMQDLASLPIGELAMEGCHLYLWVPTLLAIKAGRMMEEDWGFTYQTDIVWDKGSGVGFWWINYHEHLLFGYKDKCRFPLGRYKKNLYSKKDGWVRGKHSQKPEASYELIESVSPEPRLELFARREREGWTCVGNELTGRDVKEDIDGLIRLNGD